MPSLKSTFTFAIDTKILDLFFKDCDKKGYTKSAIIQQIIIDYLEFGLREFTPSTTRSKTTSHQIDNAVKKEVND